jgi:diguanylate cyclase (GGDEF)-like protein/PAS domain S-box-containing protein
MMRGADPATSAARRVAVGYAAVAAAWILSSDALVSATGGSVTGVWGSIARGLAFVAVTALVLHRLVAAMYRRYEARAQPLGERAQMQAALFNHSPEAMWVHDPETLEILEVNDTMVRRCGRGRDELLRMRTTDLGPGPEAGGALRPPAGGDDAPSLQVHYGPDGDHRLVEVVVRPVEWHGTMATLAVGRDVTAQKRDEDALRSSERRLAGVLASMQEMAFSIDLTTGRIEYLNEVAADVLGREPSDLFMSLSEFRDVILEEDRDLYRRAVREVVEDGWAETELRVRQPDGGIRTLHISGRGVIGPSGNVEQIDGVAIDMTHRQALVELVEHQRSFDQLTGLPNRLSFVTAMNAALAGGAEQTSGMPFVALFDLDRFAAVNQSAGHHAGDAVLVAVAERITSVLSPGMLAARVGGDEFAVFCPAGVATVGEVVERLQEAVDDVFQVGGYEFRITMSVGLAEAEDRQDAEEMLRDAHVAMSAAKERAAGVEYFHPAYRSVITEQVRIEGELRGALSGGGLVVVYQPQVSLQSDRIIGVEALVRWDHPVRGLVAAREFILAAERSNMIGEIGQQVLDQVCEQAVAWRERHGDLAPRIWLNLSRRELDTPGIATRILKRLAERHVDPSSVGVEVTETAFVADSRPAALALRELADGGVGVALDDFGTGWSSLQTLKAFPLQILKIDRSFITRVGRSVQDTQITKAVIGMARGLSLLALAEGVETVEQLAELRRLGCDQVQGHLLGRPAPAATIDEILEMGGKPTVFLR